MQITRQSPFTGRFHTREIDVTKEQLANYYRPNGPLIQDAFPHLSADDREFIKTGITAEEWDDIFGKDEEE
jgi:hypothetical protein